MSGSEAIAEEAVQDAFLAYIGSPDAFDQNRGSLEAYLYGIARNLVHRHLERNKRFEQVDDDEADIFSRESELLENLTRGEDLQALREAICGCPRNIANRSCFAICRKCPMKRLRLFSSAPWAQFGRGSTGVADS